MPTYSLAGRPRRLVFLTVALAALALGRAEAQDTARVLELVNQHRAANGLAPLIRAPELDQAAQRHSDDMANKNFSATPVRTARPRGSGSPRPATAGRPTARTSPPATPPRTRSSTPG